MDYEQKYKIALERARKIENGEPINVPDGTSIPVAIFPELKESEDEKIRKQIISFLKEFECDHYRSLDFSSWIDWLEKQGKQSSNIWHDVSEEPEENRELFCEWKGSADSIWHDVVFYHVNTKTFQGVERRIVDNVVKWTYVDEMLEKQGNNADKVEPKFNVGDWVVTDLFNIVQIKAIDNGKYVLEDTMSFSISVDYADNCWHRWTIQDAKDGDVIVYGDNHNHVEIIMLFKSVRNELSAFTHFHIFNNEFRTDNWCDCGKNAHPATKEQRDLLFQKMKEDGYEWNADEKVLNKVIIYEQK